MGFIYWIQCLINQKGYIGQTTNTVENRWKEHKQNAKYLARAVANDPTINYEGTQYKNIRNSLLYKAMVKYGIDNFTIILIEEVADEDLNFNETASIEIYNTLVPNGYNLTSGGNSKFKHDESSIALMRQVKLQNIENNRHEILRGLPPCTSYGKTDKYEWILIQNHPLCKIREFTVQKYGSLEIVKEVVMTFITNLESNGIPYQKKKKGDLIQYPGLKETKKGYKLEKYINGKKYHAGFESGKFSREENKKRAIEYYEQNIKLLLE